VRFKALIAVAAIFAATAAVPSLPAGAGPSAGGISSDNVEWVKHVPMVNGVGGRLIGKYFYVNDQNMVRILDVSDPENPVETGRVLMPQEYMYSREDIDGNGKILVIPNTVTASADGSPTASTNALYIIDVEDKTNPQIIAKVVGAAQHTISCILDCKWAYGSDGNIIDLRNPAKPKFMEEKWGDGPGVVAKGGHDVEEIAPGLVLTSTQPMMLLDARKDPLHPKLLALGSNLDGRFIHSSRWPQQGKDNFIVAGGETNNRVRCNETTGAFMTWDARNWQKTRTFTMIDEYRMVNGTFSDGNPAANVWGCSSHWLEASPHFEDGGIVAVAFFEHGTRFVDISSTGKIKEIGYFMPHVGNTGAVYWITDEILYSVDYGRGMDILRWTGPKK
jgi:LVIVD repeat